MKKILILSLLISCSQFFMSCENWFDVNPKSQVKNDILFENENGYKTALFGIYTTMATPALYGQELTMSLLDVLAQYYTINDNYHNFYNASIYNYEASTVKSKFDAIWKTMYKTIMNCNNLLENMEGRQELFSGHNYELIRGETLGLRAYLHFDLLRMFAPSFTVGANAAAIPYVDRVTRTPFPQLTNMAITEKILQDCEEALSLLEVSDPFGPAADNTEPEDEFLRNREERMNYYAVKALKARVYLWADNKAEAYREAKAVTAVQEQWFPWTERREIMDNTRNPDRIFSSELLFAAYYNAREEIFTNYFSPTLEPAQVYSPKKHIDDLFTWDLLDWRNRPIWLEGTTRDYRCFHKYEDVSSTEVWTKLIPLIRMTEMYYIIAETATDETEALDALNTVLFNRGVKELEDKTQLAGMLRDEYRREFFGEGQLFFYYKRLNVKVLHSYSENADLDMDAAKYVVPLPLSETDFR